jgi:hypothetical protein
VLRDLVAERRDAVYLEHGDLDAVRTLERIVTGDVDDLERDVERRVASDRRGCLERIRAQVAALRDVQDEVTPPQLAQG